MSVHATQLFNDGNAFDRLTVPCRWCRDGWINQYLGIDWVECPACLGTSVRSETDAEMAARLADDLDEWERLQRTEE